MIGSESQKPASAVPWYKEELFPGRLNRGNYIIGWLLFAFSLASLCMAFVLIVGPYLKPNPHPTLFQQFLILLIALPFQAISVLGSASLVVRRMHDLNMQFSMFGWSWFLAERLYFQQGTNGPNDFGAPQKGYGILQILGLK